MKTAAELQIEVQRWRNIEKGVTDPQVLAKLRELIAELEERIREAEDGS
jgi:hypothetical protein